MPLRPMPVPLRVGTDICHMPRIRQLITSPQLCGFQASQSTDIKSNMSRFLRKFLSGREQSLFWKRHEITPTAHDAHDAVIIDRAVQYLAGRWAAKEAVIKAVSPSRSISFMDVEILPRQSGSGGLFAVILDQPTSPHASSDGANSNVLGVDDANGQIAELSISHDGEYATATCIAPYLAPIGDVGGEASAREP